MEDHHVDRPEVEVRQRMKLTGTNRSIGLKPPCAAINTPVDTQLLIMPRQNQLKPRRHQTLHRSASRPGLRRPGGYSEGAPPDPIPNSAVKALRADGTSAQAAEE